MSTSLSLDATPQRTVNRWIQLVAGIIAMAAIANLQYAWTLFTGPLTRNLHASLAAVQVAFAAFVLTETWLVPFEGYLVDRIGPRAMLLFGGVLVGAGSGWLRPGDQCPGTYFLVCDGRRRRGCRLRSHHRQRAEMVSRPARIVRRPDCPRLRRGDGAYHRAYIPHDENVGLCPYLCGLGPDSGRRSLGSRERDHQAAGEHWLPEGWKEKEAQQKLRVHSIALDMTPGEMVRTGPFWLIYFMMTIVAFGGLVVTAQLSPIAKFYHVDKVPVFFGMSALVMAIEVNRILNGVTRPFWGWVSDHIGRENTMFLAFLLEAVAVFGLLQLINRPLWFILLSGICFFAWGEIFSLFPAITGDLFGRKWCTTNYGIVYTAKGVASVFAGPVAALASVKTGSWVQVFWVMIACDVIAAFMALLWLKPVAAQYHCQDGNGDEGQSSRTVQAGGIAIHLYFCGLAVGGNRPFRRRYIAAAA